MKIAIVSDSHENIPAIKAALQVLGKDNVDLILHAGDIISPIALRAFQEVKIFLIAVFGNNDGDRLFLTETVNASGDIYSGLYEREIAGKKILMMHEPRGLDSFIKSQNYDLIIYGHTHKIDTRKEGKTLVINPGELGGWLTGRKTFVILDLASMKYRLAELD